MQWAGWRVPIHPMGRGPSGNRESRLAKHQCVYILQVYSADTLEEVAGGEEGDDILYSLFGAVRIYSLMESSTR